ncbi:MAG: 1-acyl-sn-glycerol-3-phosphate acyltransferase [Myxococcales bacterium]|nr:1-acyl-sn-glycerol-3-phosphate acyltransferase [Myxococcales bacterium]
MDARDRQRICREVPQRIVDGVRARAGDDHDYSAALLNETIFAERERLRRKRTPARAEQKYYDALHRRLLESTPEQQLTLVGELAERFVSQIVGPSSQRVYRAATTVVPAALAMLLNLREPQRLLSLDNITGGLSHQIALASVFGDSSDEGIAALRALSERGTLIVVPTHVSNLDPMIMAYGLSLAGLPRFQFGGKAELFANRATAFFMHTIGAYRVERKKNAALYKDVLKQYVTRALELGYHNIFFPGGTRSRSGAIESRLKKGLLGTAVGAFTRSLCEARARGDEQLGRPIYIVPCAISYKLVLEAETLIDSHLSAEGQGAYIIEDDELARPTRVASYLSRLVSHGGKITVTLGVPRDIVGNRVDSTGRSLDARGRPVSTRDYVLRDGEPHVDPQRDRVYTDELGERIVEDFRRLDVLRSTHVVASALLDELRRRSPELSIYRLLQTGGETRSLRIEEVHQATARRVGEIAALADAGPRLGSDVKGVAAETVVDDALEHFAIYHRRPAARRRGDRVFLDNRNLVAYYANRVAPYWDANALRRFSPS